MPKRSDEMNEKDIKNALIEIQAVLPEDNGQAHILEDALVHSYIESMAAKGDKLAKEVLKVYDIDYDRWYE